jgi:hypothetical protein
MKFFVSLLLGCITFPAIAVECDKVGALNTKIMLSKLATWQKERAHIAVHWTFAIERDSKEKQLQTLRAFADTDACLTDEAREIWFYRNRKLIGVASPTRGVQLID